MYYYLPQPPLALLFFGFFIGVTCGLAFDASLKQQVLQWQKEVKKGESTNLSQMSRFLLPFFGICFGICVFLAAGLEIFIYDRVVSYIISGVLTLLTAALIWNQLKKLITQLLESGSKSLDLDVFY